MNREKIYNKYHEKIKIQKHIISNSNFTYRNVLKILRPLTIPNNSVLDIGCGAGSISYYLASKGMNVTGIDISKRAIIQNIRNAKFLGLEEKIKFIKCDFPNKKIQGKFDLIILSEVIEHIPNDSSGIKVIVGLLKKSGNVLISVPSSMAPLYKLGLLKEFDKRVGHLRRYTPVEIEKLLKRNGLVVEKIYLCEGLIRNTFYTISIFGKLIRFIRWPFTEIISVIDNIFGFFLGYSQIIVISTKR